MVMGPRGEKCKSYFRAVVSRDEGGQVGQLQGKQVEEGPEGVWKARVLWGRELPLEGAVLGVFWETWGLWACRTGTVQLLYLHQ